jgi:transposase
MLQFSSELKVYVSETAIDFRKSINGLIILVADELKHNPQSGYLYLFHNQARNKIKGLYWDANGFVLLYKRLERGRFYFQRNDQGVLEITSQQLSWLLAGLDFMRMSQFPSLDFTGYY